MNTCDRAIYAYATSDLPGPYYAYKAGFTAGLAWVSGLGWRTSRNPYSVAELRAAYDRGFTQGSAVAAETTEN